MFLSFWMASASSSEKPFGKGLPTQEQASKMVKQTPCGLLWQKGTARTQPRRSSGMLPAAGGAPYFSKTPGMTCRLNAAASCKEPSGRR